MAVPSYEQMMSTIMSFLNENERGSEKGEMVTTEQRSVHSLKELIEHVVSFYNLTDDDKKQTIPSGQNLIYNRVNWACTYLCKAKLLEREKEGTIELRLLE